jgi:hypothetical protein
VSMMIRRAAMSAGTEPGPAASSFMSHSIDLLRLNNIFKEIGTSWLNIFSWLDERVLGVTINSLCRSQWPCGLRYELSSLARTLGSWVRIPLKASVSVCVYCVCDVLCVVSGIVTG